MSNPERLQHPLGDGNINTTPPPKRIKGTDSAHYDSTLCSPTPSGAQSMPEANKDSHNKKETKNVLSHILADEIVDKDTLDFLMGETSHTHHLVTEDDATGQEQLELNDAPNIYVPEDNNLLLDKQLLESDLQGLRSYLAYLETRLRQMPLPQQQYQQQGPAAAAQYHQRQQLLNERIVLAAMIKSSEDWLRYIEHGDPLDYAA